LPSLLPKPTGGKLPALEWVEPGTLFIEDSYQRNLSENSIRLIRRIVAEWSWARMKPPICAKGSDNKLCVIDGQHTAIAAASHGGIKKIPVMIVDAATVKDRAASFMGHNRDRVAMTAPQLFYAAVAADDEVAVAAAEACKKAGVTIRKSMPTGGIWKIGETISPTSILAVAKLKGTPGATRVLKILVEAERAPITALEVKAVAGILFDKAINGGKAVDAFDLATTIRSRTATGWLGAGEAGRKQTGVPVWRAVAAAWLKSMPKQRG
jgi:hypothetical protein